MPLMDEKSFCEFSRVIFKDLKIYNTTKYTCLKNLNKCEVNLLKPPYNTFFFNK